jgi:hypothetical protein
MLHLRFSQALVAYACHPRQLPGRREPEDCGPSPTPGQNKFARPHLNRTKPGVVERACHPGSAGKRKTQDCGPGCRKDLPPNNRSKKDWRVAQAVERADLSSNPAPPPKKLRLDLLSRICSVLGAFRVSLGSFCKCHLSQRGDPKTRSFGRCAWPASPSTSVFLHAPSSSVTRCVHARGLVSPR